MSSRAEPPSPPSGVGDRFLEIADVMMIAIDATGKVTYANAKARNILGYGTLVGADWFDMCIPDRMQEEVRGVFDRLMAGEIEADERHENAVVTADGEERIIEWHNTVLQDDEGCITGTLSSGQDVTERKELERQELYLESVSALVTVVDENGTIRYDSPGISEMLGYEPDERVGESTFAHIHPDDRERVKERFRTRVVGSGTPQSIEFRTRRKDGEWIWVESRARVLTDTPPVDGIVITTQDITDRKEREAKLERIETLFEHAQDALFLIAVGEEMIVEQVNPAWEDATGVPAERVQGWTLQEVLGEEAGETAEEKYRECVRRREPLQYEERIPFEGELTEWVTRIAPVVIDGTVEYIAGSTREVSDRKERRAELRQFKEMIKAMSHSVYITDADGTIEYVNPAFETTTGYSAEEAVGRTPRILNSGEHDEEFYEELWETILAGDVWRGELINTTKDGDKYVITQTITPITDETGAITNFVAVNTDITERKQQERKRQRELERVTDGIIKVDTDWQCTTASDRVEELVGVSKADLLGRNVWEVFDDTRGTTFEKRYREVMNTRESVSFVEYDSNRETWFDVQAYPDNDGGISIYFRDVTERKEQEQARQRAEKQYQTLLEMAPDPIIAADAETAEIIEVNEAAENLLEQSESDLVGQVRYSLFPADKMKTYERFFTDALGQDEGVTRRMLPDGSPICIVTGAGDKIPVEVSIRSVELDGRDVAFGIFRDIGDELEYERQLTTLNETTRELFEAETARDVEQTAVEAMSDVLDVSTVAFYHFDDEDQTLQPVTATDPGESTDSSDHPPVLEPGIGVEWHALSTGETTLVDDFRTRETECEFERAVRSELVVPVADRGVLVAGDTQPAVFTDQTVSLVETLGATAEAALSRAVRGQQLQDQRRELKRVESINEQIRDISHAIVQSETRAELEQMVCECLARSEIVDFAWTGRVDLGEQQLSPQARAGDAEGYLDSIPLGLDEGGGSEPSVQAARSRDVSGSSNIATDIHRDNWRTVAVERGFQSVLSIPLVYEETLYGILSVYARTQSGFPSALRSVLEDLGDLIAHSIVAMERKEVLHTEQTMELDFVIQDRTCLFCRIVTGTDLGLELDGFVPQSDQSTLVFARITDGTPERVLEEVEQLDGVERGRLIERGTDTFVQMYVTGLFLGSELSNRGLILRRLSADHTGSQVTVEVPRMSDARQAVDLVLSQYDDAQLLAKRESSTSSDSMRTMPGNILETLTTRQREVIETAYRCGYFDSPRRANGQEIAEMFGFSNPTFHQHVREAEKKLFETLLGGAGALVTATERSEPD
jgi:PAS domain S-box-containing protein